jgi:hypothetical protein
MSSSPSLPDAIANAEMETETETDAEATLASSDSLQTDMPLTMAASVVLEHLPRDAHTALSKAGLLEQDKSMLSLTTSFRSHFSPSLLISPFLYLSSFSHFSHTSVLISKQFSSTFVPAPAHPNSPAVSKNTRCHLPSTSTPLSNSFAKSYS